MVIFPIVLAYLTSLVSFPQLAVPSISFQLPVIKILGLANVTYEAVICSPSIRFKEGSEEAGEVRLLRIFVASCADSAIRLRKSIWQALGTSLPFSISTEGRHSDATR